MALSADTAFKVISKASSLVFIAATHSPLLSETLNFPEWER